MTKIIPALICLLCIGCAKDLVTGESTYNMYGVNDDVQLGEQVMASQLKELEAGGKKVDTDKTELERIQTISSLIAAVSHQPNFPYEVHLAEVDIVNAWCAPGGKIMVYSGLWGSEKGLVRKGDDDELAAVLAHEISHATARHVTESVSKIQGISLVGQVALSAISAGGSAAGANLFEKVFVGGMNVYLPSYSRKNESEADRIGLIYMAKAGYDPRAAVRLWRRASKKRGDQTSIFASHPASGKRANDLEAHLPEAMAIYNQAIQ